MWSAITIRKKIQFSDDNTSIHSHIGTDCTNIVYIERYIDLPHGKFRYWITGKINFVDCRYSKLIEFSIYTLLLIEIHFIMSANLNVHTCDILLTYIVSSEHAFMHAKQSHAF